jgi:hypothetical protein
MTEPIRRSRRLVKDEDLEDGPSTSKYFPENRHVESDPAILSHVRSKRDSSDSPTKPHKRVKLEDTSHDRSASSPLTDLEELPPHLRLQSIPIKVETALSTTPKSKKPVVKLKLEKPHRAPENWEKQWDLILRMRAKIIAPVDTLSVPRRSAYYQ